MFTFRIILLLIVALVNIFLAWVVYFRNKRSKVNISFSIFAFAVGIWGFILGIYYFSESLNTDKLLMQASYGAATVIGASFYYLSLNFPTREKKTNSLGILLLLLSIFLFFIIFIPGLLVKDIIRENLDNKIFLNPLGYYIFALFFIFTFWVGMIILWKKYFTNKGIVKKQIFYIVSSGSIAGILGTFFNLILPSPFFHNFQYIWIGPLFTVIWSGFITYAIIRHRLLDIRIFVIRSILYTLTVVMVGMMFTWIVFNIGENILESATLGVIIGSVVISLGLEPLLHFLRRVTDEYFFQERYNYQNTLRELVKSMTRIIDLQALLDTTTITIKNALKLEKIAIALFDPDKVVPSVIKEVGFAIPLDTHLCKKKSLVKYLAETKIELVAAELEIEQERGRLNVSVERAGIIIREMRNLDIAMCIPIFSNEEMIGILALGNKKSGDVFSNDDIQLLNTFAGQAGIAIVNAKLYQEVKDFNLRLQEKVNHATRDLRRSNKELREANIRLRELDQAKSDFISLASHQLRAPLSITKGYVSMILEGTYGDCPTDLIEPLNMVYNGNERLIKFVNNLLDVSRMESGRLEYVFQNVDLSAMAESVTKELKLAADKKEIFLQTDIEKGLPLVKADDEKLRQVVMNLVDNAIKYTPSGGVTVSLKEGDSSDRKKGLIFSVTDSGRGLEEADKASLFQKFSRGQGVSRIHTEGTGLGLYVAAKIIEAHQGTIWADSPGKDQGSTFAFWVPVGEIKEGVKEEVVDKVM